MASTKNSRIFLISLVITVLIFIIGIGVNYIFDFFRIDAIEEVIADHELDTESFLIEKRFIESIHGDRCDVMTRRMSDLKNEVHKVGSDLTNYGTKSIFKKTDFDYLKRKYFLLELSFLSTINKLNAECGTSFIPVIFFYEIDHPDSLTQGFILEDLSQGYRNQLVVLSFDKDYEDEPVLELLKNKYNVTQVPLVIIGNASFTKLTYVGDLNATVHRMLNVRRTDPSGSLYDFSKELRNTNTDESLFLAEYQSLLKENLSNFARGEVMLVLGRLMHNDTLICEALQYYDASISDNEELNALVYETVASLDCGRNVKAFYIEAANSWEKTGNGWRARIDRELAYKYVITPEFDSTDMQEFSLDIPDTASSITIGSTQMNVSADDLIVAQVDRVSRDWLTYQLANLPGDTGNLLTVFSERKTYNDSELMPEIGWHEGARLKEMTRLGTQLDTAFGTMVARKDGKWYAPNEDGMFMFEVPEDKILYPTTRFLQEDLAVIVDTHGINMIVEQALRKDADMAVGCCDSLGKIKAAVYLSEKGMDVVCFTDKYLPLALGSNASILGNPPITVKKDAVVLGARPLTFSFNETFVVMNSTADRFAMSYYQTPSIYFSNAGLPVKTDYVTIDDFGQMQRVIERANELDANIIAVRVFNSEDYYPVKQWLDESHMHRAILFHSMPYPYGYKIMQEYPLQTTFDDINPLFS